MRKLDLIDQIEQPGELHRHPADGWSLAEPRKVGPRTHRILLKLADAIVPPAPRQHDTLEHLVRHLLISLQYMPESTARSMIVLAHVLNFAPLWRLRGLRTLMRCNVDEVRAELRSLAASRFLPIRMLMLAPQALFMSFYFDLDLVHPHLDYEPIAFTKERIALRMKLKAGRRADHPDTIPPYVPSRPPGAKP